MFVDWGDRTISNTTPFAGGDPHGTNAFNGTYKSDAILVSVGKSF